MALQAGGVLLADEEHILGVRIHRRRSVFRVAVKLRLPSKGGGSALLKGDFSSPVASMSMGAVTASTAESAARASSN